MSTEHAAQAPQAAEPVACPKCGGNGIVSAMADFGPDDGRECPLCKGAGIATAQVAPAAQPLTENDIARVAAPFAPSVGVFDVFEFARHIEHAVWAKLGIAPSAQGET